MQETDIEYLLSDIWHRSWKYVEHRSSFNRQATDTNRQRNRYSSEEGLTAYTTSTLTTVQPWNSAVLAFQQVSVWLWGWGSPNCENSKETWGTEEIADFRWFRPNQHPSFPSGFLHDMGHKWNLWKLHNVALPLLQKVPSSSCDQPMHMYVQLKSTSRR